MMLSKSKIDANTVLLLHCNGSNNSTTFVDEAGKTISRGGDAKLNKDIYKFGGSSLMLNGSTDYVTTPDSSDFDFGNGDFTIDFWCYFNAFNSTTATGIFSQRSSSTSNVALYCYIAQNADRKMYLYYTTNGNTTVGGGFNTVFTAGQWYHVAIVRNGTEIGMYVNGVKEANTINVGTSTFYSSAENISIGAMKTGVSTYSHWCNGYLDEFCVRKGIAKYTANFTPPTREYYGGA